MYGAFSYCSFYHYQRILFFAKRCVKTRQQRGITA